MLAYAKRQDRSKMLKHIENQGMIDRSLYTIHENVMVTQSEDTRVQNSTVFMTPDPLDQTEETYALDTNDYMKTMIEDKFSDVKSFFAKPARVTTIAWPSTAVFNDDLYSVNDAFSIISSVPTWIEKLRGFQGIKATLCIKLVGNFTNYSAGKLRLVYYPGGDGNLRKATAHFGNVMPASQLPGVDLNCREPTAVLKIPYQTELQYYQLTENSTSWASIRLKVFAPYRTGPDNQQTVNVTMWCWLEDVHLYGQTHPGVVTQSLDIPSKPPPSEMESKPISGFFGGLSSALTSLSSIPLLAPYLGTPIWVTNALKGVASSFGYSKPNKAMLYQRNAVGSLQNMANSDGERAGNSLSLLSDAKVMGVNDLTRTGMDETSINFIKTHESFWTNGVWSTSLTPGAVLISRFISPREAINVGSPTEIYHTPMGYLSRWFQLWRGAIKVRIEFVKTNLHKGQVMVLFQPGPSVASTIDTSTYLYREIVDLEEVDSIEFILPYINAYEYLPVGTPSGRLEVLVVNPLQAPETVSTSIDILYYISGHESLQFGRPVAPSNMNVFVTQSRDLVKMESKPIGNANINDLNIGSSARCMSEYVSSISQLARRHYPFDNFVLTPLQPFMALNPYTLPCNATGAQNLFSNALSVLAAPYAFIRGGMEFNITSTTVGAFPQIVRYADDGDTELTYLASPGAANAVTICNNVNGGILVEIPYYAVTRATPVRYSTNPLTQSVGFDEPRGRLIFDFNTGTSVVSRAVADDFQFLFFVGIPRMSGTFT